MIRPIAPLGQLAAEEAAQRTDEKNVHRAAMEFEGVLIKQLLESTELAKQGGTSTHGSMVVDAMAEGLQRAGGLGFAQMVAEMLAEAQPK